MKQLFLFLAIGSWAFGAETTISDTVTSAVGTGGWTGKITVTLTAPGASMPLFDGSVSLAGFTQVLCLGITDSQCTSTHLAGGVSIVLRTNSTITPAGTSYTARFQPSRGSPWTEPWIVAVGNTKLYQIRGSAISPNVMVNPQQISAGGASAGDILTWNGQNWTFGPAQNNRVVEFTSQTSVSVPATSHGFLSASLIVQCFDGSGVGIECAVNVNPTTFDVTVSFAVAQTGKVVVNGSDYDNSLNVSKQFTAATNISISAAEHGYANSRLLAQCYLSTGAQFDCVPTVNPTTFAVSITLASAATGRVILTGR